MAAAGKKSTYTATEVAALEDTIAKQTAEIDELKRKKSKPLSQRSLPRIPFL